MFVNYEAMEMTWIEKEEIGGLQVVDTGWKNTLEWRKLNDE